jgi:hypothetical protein
MAALLPALLCGGGMVVCFLLMGRMHGRTPASDHDDQTHDSADVATLRHEVDQLRAELRARDEGSQPAPELNQN